MSRFSFVILFIGGSGEKLSFYIVNVRLSYIDLSCDKEFLLFLEVMNYSSL